MKFGCPILASLTHVLVFLTPPRCGLQWFPIFIFKCVSKICMLMELIKCVFITRFWGMFGCPNFITLECADITKITKLYIFWLTWSIMNTFFNCHPWHKHIGPTECTIIRRDNRSTNEALYNTINTQTVDNTILIIKSHFEVSLFTIKIISNTNTVYKITSKIYIEMDVLKFWQSLSAKLLPWPRPSAHSSNKANPLLIVLMEWNPLVPCPVC